MCCGNTNNTGCNGGCNDRCNDPCNKCQPSRCECLVRYSGPDIDCLGVETDDSFETVITKVAGFVCDLTFEDGADGVDGAPGTPGEQGEPGINANSNYGNTLFVDQIYGDDLTALRERFDLPYRNIQTAIGVAQAGDTVWVRTGTYTESIDLKDLVGLHFEKVVLQGQISNNAQAIRSRVTGGLTIVWSGSNALNFTGQGYDILVDINEINSYGTAIYLNNVSKGLKSRVNIRLNRITGIEVNYALSINELVDANINVVEKIETKPVTSPSGGLSIIRVNSEFVGRLDLECPYVYIGNSESSQAGVLYSDGFASGGGGDVNVKIGKVNSDFLGLNMEGLLYTNFGTIDRLGASRACFEIGTMIGTSAVTRDGIHIKGAGVGPTYFKGSIKTNSSSVIRYAASGVLVVKDSRLQSNSAESFRPTIIVGNSSGTLAGGIETGYKFSIEDSVVIKNTTQEGTDLTENIIFKSGVPPIYLKNVDLYGTGFFAGRPVSTSVGVNKDIYFRDVSSNFAINTLDVTDISSGGFTLEENMVVHQVGQI